MARPRLEVPSRDGELLTWPDVDEWASLTRENASLARAWVGDVGGWSLAELRRSAREQALKDAVAFSSRLGVPVTVPAGTPELLVMTGHQPELYHPGVWVKDFLLQRLAEETGGTAVDLVVDSDRFDVVDVTAPCMTPEVSRCAWDLAVGDPQGCYACTPVPAQRAIEEVCEAAGRALDALPEPSVAVNFRRFCTSLRSAASDADNLAELITFARRRYERTAGTDYLELPLSTVVGTESYRRFAASLLVDAASFARRHNDELGAFRSRTGTRSAAQPWPDLESDGTWAETPFWALGRGRRDPVFVGRPDGMLRMRLGDGEIELPGDADRAAKVLAGLPIRLAPRAVTLTMFTRVFLADMFIHGVGGGDYDQVTDAVIAGYFGIEPPKYVVASLTMLLPLGGPLVTQGEVSALRQQIHRIAHNPDSLLDEVPFDSREQQAEATRLAEKKAQLVEAISKDGADKKDLGAQIRQVNRALGMMLAPLKADREEELRRLEGLQAETEILMDRTYPFCFWDPEELRDQVR